MHLHMPLELLIHPRSEFTDVGFDSADLAKSNPTLVISLRGWIYNVLGSYSVMVGSPWFPTRISGFKFNLSWRIQFISMRLYLTSPIKSKFEPRLIWRIKVQARENLKHTLKRRIKQKKEQISYFGFIFVAVKIV